MVVERFLSLVLLVQLLQLEARELTIEDVQSGYRISSPSTSFQNGLTTFSARRHNLETNEDSNTVWVARNNEENVVQLTEESPDHSDTSPFWIDSENIGFLSTRSGTQQLWELNISDRQPRQLTDFALDINHVRFHSLSGTLIFASRVFPDMSIEETAEELARREDDVSTGMMFEKLYVRFWDTYEDGRFSHLFATRIQLNTTTTTAVDLMAGLRENCPGRRGSISDYDICSDGHEVAYASAGAGVDEAWSSNIDIHVVSTQGTIPREQLTTSLAIDESPRYSPDGSKIAFLANTIPRYGADFRRVMIYNRATRTTTQLSQADRSYGGMEWATDSQSIYATAQNHGRVPIFHLDIESGTEDVVIDTHSNGNIQVGPDGGLVFLQQSIVSPAELHRLFPISSGGSTLRLTNLNTGLLTDVDMSPVEEFTFVGSEDDENHGWILKPFDYKPGQQYPLAFLIHGGPQSAWNDDWSYRWNLELFAGHGYAVVAINPHGSTGYGQDFMDAILSNWGSLPYEDLMIGLDYVIEEYDFIDPNQLTALGASYGGYMTNWIRGQTDRFNCLVTHAGLYDLVNFWYITEALDFMEFNNGDTPPFISDKIYQRYNPENHITKWKTPTLVTHGALDYRVPEDHGIAVFQALQRMGVESKYLLFPDENHWILKPANSVQWYHEVLKWLDEHTDNKFKAEL